MPSVTLQQHSLPLRRRAQAAQRRSWAFQTCRHTHGTPSTRTLAPALIGALTHGRWPRWKTRAGTNLSCSSTQASAGLSCLRTGRCDFLASVDALPDMALQAQKTSVHTDAVLMCRAPGTGQRPSQTDSVTTTSWSVAVQSSLLAVAALNSRQQCGLCAGRRHDLVRQDTPQQ